MLAINIKNQELILSPKKALFWMNQNILILSDLHLGKVISEFENELDRLESLIWEFLPTKIIILGDLFHSTFNKNFRYFKIFRLNYKNIEMILVKGNHDKLKPHIYSDLKLKVYELQKTIKPFTFIHQPVSRSYDLNINNYFISGHVHPVIKFNLGKASCFCFGKNQAVLPAFSQKVRNCLINPEHSDKLFILAGNKVVDLSNNY